MNWHTVRVGTICMVVIVGISSTREELFQPPIDSIPSEGDDNNTLISHNLEDAP